MKKFILSAVAAMLCIGLTACGETAEESSSPATTAEPATTTSTAAPEDTEPQPETQETTTTTAATETEPPEETTPPTPEPIEVTIDDLDPEDAEMFNEYIAANGIEGGHFYRYNGEEITEPVYFIPIPEFYNTTLTIGEKEYAPDTIYLGDRLPLMLCPLDLADEYMREDVAQEIRDIGLYNFVAIREWTEQEMYTIVPATKDAPDKYDRPWTDEWFQYIDVYYIP